ncbi:MAG TPA: hypothetical protein VIE43_18715 [Thermoanaerobaculia bacterium]|nr:hypothetical protein [Thermoanaerobaculia bacterium]
MMIERQSRPGLKSRAIHDGPSSGPGKSGGRPSVARDFNPGQRAARIFLLFLLIGLASLPLHADAPNPSATAVLAEFDHLAVLPLWPRFDPRQIPVAIYDGERTILVRHPSPPAEFKPDGDLRVFPGRHEAMNANTAVDLGGVKTATLEVDPKAGRSARDWASILTHETFHVFQRQHHPTWEADEGELFLYPVNDASLLAARRLETEGFRRALAAADAREAACWTGQALKQRRERFGRMTPGAVGYERGTELNEGLANFVENLSLGKTQGPDLPALEYGAEAIRNRAYAIGYAEAALLGRFDPTWRQTLEDGKAPSLDELLAKTIAGKPAAACAFPPAGIAAAGERAKADVQQLDKSRRESLDAFLKRPGWRIEIVAAAHPLSLHGFDPLNVSLVAKGEILHRRYLELGDKESSLKVLDAQALTEAAGEHPLFNGVKDLRMTGLAAEPKVRQDGDFTVIEAAGLTAKLKGAKVEKGDGSLKVILP